MSYLQWHDGLKCPGFFEVASGVCGVRCCGGWIAWCTVSELDNRGIDAAEVDPKAIGIEHSS